MKKEALLAGVSSLRLKTAVVKPLCRLRLKALGARVVEEPKYTYYPRDASSEDLRSQMDQPSALEYVPRKPPTYFSRYGWTKESCLPYWYPEDADYKCDRDANGLCVVNPILCPYKDMALHDQIDNYYEMLEVSY